jgi:activator of HSP90 ATPase
MHPLTSPDTPAMLMPTRRRILSSFAVAAAGCAVCPTLRAQQMAQLPPASPTDTRTALHQEIELPAAPARVETALLDTQQFTAFTGLPATIDPHEGGALNLFGGLVVGRNIELVSGQRIVQAWRPTHWDPGVFSLVKFEFQPHAAGAILILDHSSFPAGEYAHLTSGWTEHYWNPLKKYLA